MLKRLGSLIWYWTPVFLWMGVIFYASSISGGDMPKMDIPNIDKLFHFVEYFVLGFILVRAFTHSSKNPRYVYIFIAAVAIASVYGASDEYHQRFVAERSCDIIDFLMDVIGSSLGAGLSIYKERIKSAVDKTI